MKVVLNIFSNPMQHIIKARQNSLGTIQFSAVYRSQESNIGGTWVLNRTPGQSHMQNLNSYIFFLNFLSDYILTYCNPSVPLLFLSGQEVAEKSRLLTCISLWAYITSPSPIVHSKTILSGPGRHWPYPVQTSMWSWFYSGPAAPCSAPRVQAQQVMSLPYMAAMLARQTNISSW